MSSRMSSADAESRAASRKTAALFTQPDNGPAASARAAASCATSGSRPSPLTSWTAGLAHSSVVATSSTTT